MKTVHGEPIVAEGKTIIPVARVSYGFGGGGGTRKSKPSSDGGEGPPETGGGGGGGMSVSPVGIIEVTPGETRYISFEDRRTIIRAVLLGSLLAVFLLRRRRRG